MDTVERTYKIVKAHEDFPQNAKESSASTVPFDKRNGQELWIWTRNKKQFFTTIGNSESKHYWFPEFAYS